MSRCEQELCIYWEGNDGCPCAVFDLTPIGAEGQRLQLTASEIAERDAWDDEEEVDA